MNAQENAKLAKIVEHLIDDDLCEDDADWLNEVLRNDTDARELFLGLTRDNAQLCLNWPHLEQQKPVPLDDEPSVFRTDVRFAESAAGPAMRIPNAGALAVVALCAGLLLVATLSAWPPAKPHAPFVATLTQCSDAQWAESTLPTTIHTPLGPGRMRLKHGTCTLRYSSGVEVLLSGDVDFELVDESSATLHSGVAKARVPESARVFTINTPNASAVEHGTEFSMAFNPVRRTSRVRVIDGSVAVRHQGTGKQRTVRKGETVEATSRDLVEADSSIPEGEQHIPPPSSYLSQNAVRISTAMGRGRDATVIMSNDATYLDPALVVVKNCESEYRRKGYLGFDLQSIKGRNFDNARLILTLQEDHWYSLRAPYDVVYSVFGVTEESLDDWQAEEIRWENAPANVDASNEVDPAKGRRLGSMVVLGGRATGQVILQSDQLTEFLKEDTNGLVTLVVVRDSPVSSDEYTTPNGFASRRHNSALPPTLEVQIVPHEQAI